MNENNGKIEFFDGGSKQQLENSQGKNYTKLVISLSCLIILLGLFVYFYVLKPSYIVNDCNSQIAKISNDSVDMGKGIGFTSGTFVVSGEQIKENRYSECFKNSGNIFTLDSRFSYEQGGLLMKFTLIYLLVTFIMNFVSIKFFGNSSIGKSILLGVIFSSTSYILFAHHIFSGLLIIIPSMILIYYLLKMHDWFDAFKISYFWLYTFNGVLYVMLYFAYAQSNTFLPFMR